MAVSIWQRDGMWCQPAISLAGLPREETADGASDSWKALKNRHFVSAWVDLCKELIETWVFHGLSWKHTVQTVNTYEIVHLWEKLQIHRLPAYNIQTYKNKTVKRIELHPINGKLHHSIENNKKLCVSHSGKKAFSWEESSKQSNSDYQIVKMCIWRATMALKQSHTNVPQDHLNTCPFKKITSSTSSTFSEYPHWEMRL